MYLKEIALEYRPREHLEKVGVAALSTAELLAIVLQKGTRGENVVDLSHRLLSVYDLEKLAQCSLTELQTFKGIGMAKACQVLALFEFAKRCSIHKTQGSVITCAKDVYEHCFPRIGHAEKEHVLLLHLNTKHQVVKEEVISIGTLNASLIHPREIFKSAIKENAQAVILVHNHPSGDPTPSEEDKMVTAMLLSN